MDAEAFDRALLWRYRAKLLSVTDGDTCIVECDTGFYGRHEVRVRLLDYSAPETHQLGGRKATLQLEAALATGIGEWPLRVETLQRETAVSEVRSFERYVATVWVVQPDDELIDVTELLG